MEREFLRLKDKLNSPRRQRKSRRRPGVAKQFGTSSDNLSSDDGSPGTPVRWSFLYTVAPLDPYGRPRTTPKELPIGEYALSSPSPHEQTALRYNGVAAWVPTSVLEGVTAMLSAGLPDPCDRGAVVYKAQVMGHTVAAFWITGNWQGWCHGVLNGFAGG